jgi:hypothetical protein
MKFGPVFAFTLFFALSAVILWGAWQTTEWLSRTCPTPLPTSIEVENFQPRSAEDGRKSADDSEHYASRKKAAANKFMPLVREVKTEEQKSETGEASPDTQREPSDWWAKFKCEVKATDVALATFTAMLVLVGSFRRTICLVLSAPLALLPMPLCAKRMRWSLWNRPCRP